MRPTKTQSAARALGRLGGLANTARQQATRRANISHSQGRPMSYRVQEGTLQRRVGDRWLALEPPYDQAARAFLRRNPSIFGHLRHTPAF